MSRLAKNMDEQCHYGYVDGGKVDRCQLVEGHDGSHIGSLNIKWDQPTSEREQAQAELNKRAVVIIKWLTLNEIDDISDQTILEIADEARKYAVTLGLIEEGAKR